MMELLNTNDELFKLLTCGEEGVDYTWDEDGTVLATEGGYSFLNWNEWQLAQSFDPDCTRLVYADNEKGEGDKELFKRIVEVDKTAAVSPLSGFVFDSESVKTEMANVAAVVQEMLPALVTGSVNPEEQVPVFLERLEQAGASKIVAEKQAQLDTWNASK